MMCKISGQTWTSILLVISQIVHIGNNVTNEQKRNYVTMCTCGLCLKKRGNIIMLGVSVDTPPKAINSLIVALSIEITSNGILMA